ncbi:MAG: SDR family oxidoreductase [Pseudomonadales bacterium]|jgi:NAD(P)-dependent dehydrogenase (short-subunit alcohol dehydrogenase family)|nr:SDR family oxidoreductase [Pseudomonadales bacterium]
MQPNLDDRVYIVTGGSRGFGLAIARALTTSGARVGLVSRNATALEGAVASLGADRAFAVSMDVSDRADIARAFTCIKAHFGRLDGLINNAGLARPGAVEHLDAAEVQAQVATNLLGTVYCCQAAIPLLRGGDNPRIVNISSASAYHFDEMSHLSIYAATKAAVERFSRDLRRELQTDGIGVTILRPGAAATEFAAGWNPERFEPALKAWLDQGRLMDVGMDAAHVGATVAYCLCCPAGVSIDLLEVRPFHQVPKPDVAVLMAQHPA